MKNEKMPLEIILLMLGIHFVNRFVTCIHQIFSVQDLDYKIEMAYYLYLFGQVHENHEQKNDLGIPFSCKR